MTEEDTEKLKGYLTSEMVSRVTLAETINIMHNLATQEVEDNVNKMSDEEKESVLKELSEKVDSSKAEKSEEKSEEKS